MRQCLPRQPGGDSDGKANRMNAYYKTGALACAVVGIAACFPIYYYYQQYRHSDGIASLLCTRLTNEMFPQEWMQAPYFARAYGLHDDEIPEIQRAATSALEEYPRGVCTRELDRVFLVQRLGFSGIVAGGTNAPRAIYIARFVGDLEIAELDLRRAVHHEFSSVLLRKYAGPVYAATWAACNPPDFVYSNDPIGAGVDGHASMHFDPTMAANGFVNEYSYTSLENDFNCIASFLFEPPDGFWAAVDASPRLAAKVRLALHFYQDTVASKYSEQWARSREGGR